MNFFNKPFIVKKTLNVLEARHWNFKERTINGTFYSFIYSLMSEELKVITRLRFLNIIELRTPNRGSFSINIIIMKVYWIWVSINITSSCIGGAYILSRTILTVVTAAPEVVLISASFEKVIGCAAIIVSCSWEKKFFEHANSTRLREKKKKKKSKVIASLHWRRKTNRAFDRIGDWPETSSAASDFT